MDDHASSEGREAPKENASILTNEYFTRLFNEVHEAIVLCDNEGRVMRANREFVHMFGYSEEEVRNRLIDDFVSPEKLRAEAVALTDTARAGGRFSVETVRFRKGDSPIDVSIIGAPVIVEGRQVAVYAIYRDISVQKRMISALVESRKKIDRLMRLKDAILAISASILTLSDISQLFDLILEKVLAAVDHADVGCVLLLAEDGSLRIAASWGYSQADAKEFSVRIEDTFQWKKAKGYSGETLIINHLQEFMRENDIPAKILKDERGLEIRSTMSAPLLVEGKFYGLINLDSRENDVFDDTDRSLIEYIRSQVPIAIGMFRSYERVKELVAEKDLILKEVHHRIKNNMSTISSLLHLQQASLKEPGAVTALADAGSRVQSMMVLYEKLYISRDFRTISLESYIPALIEEILGNFALPSGIKVEFDVEDIFVNTKVLQPLGIAANELITNIGKYAFGGRDEGHIVAKARREGKHVRLTIEDDGIGMPDSVDIGRSTGFGLTLVSALMDQIGGSVRIEKGRGTRVILTFPVD